MVQTNTNTQRKKIESKMITNSVFSPIGSIIQSIQYPISIKGYISKWGISEILREFVSNALDTSENKEEIKILIDKENNNLCIKDNGCGFTQKALLMGVSEKTVNNAIGQFGEGMKLALLCCLRANINVAIYTKDLIIVPVKFTIEEIDCLQLNIYQNKEKIEGTEVYLNYNSEEILKYLEKFLVFFPQTVLYTSNYGEVLQNTRNIYSKGVKISEMDVIFGYNLNQVQLNRDRNAIDTSELSIGISQILHRIENKEIISELLRNKDRGCFESTISLDFHPYVLEIWIKMFGKKSVISTKEDLFELMKYKHLTPVSVPEKWIMGLRIEGIKRDIDIVLEEKEEMNNNKEYKISTLKINSEQRKNLSIAIKLCQKGIKNYLEREVSLDDIKNLIRLVENVSDENVLGYPKENHICLVMKALNTLQDALDTLAHELVHHYTNIPDGAKFSVALSNFLTSIIVELKGLNGGEN